MTRGRRSGRRALGLAAAGLLGVAAASCFVEIAPLAKKDAGAGGQDGGGGAGIAGGGGAAGGGGGAGGAAPDGGPLGCSAGCPEDTHCENDVCRIEIATPTCGSAIDASKGGTFLGSTCNGFKVNECVSQPHTGLLFTLDGPGAVPGTQYQVDVVADDLWLANGGTACMNYGNCLTQNSKTMVVNAGRTFVIISELTACQDVLVFVTPP